MSNAKVVYYVGRVKRGKITLGEVPAQLREAVEAKLADDGWTPGAAE